MNGIRWFGPLTIFVAEPLTGPHDDSWRTRAGGSRDVSDSNTLTAAPEIFWDIERGEKRSLIDQSTTRGIDDRGVVLHLCESRFAEAKR
jgi:hypothetical protein